MYEYVQCDRPNHSGMKEKMFVSCVFSFNVLTVSIFLSLFSEFIYFTYCISIVFVHCVPLTHFALTNPKKTAQN